MKSRRKPEVMPGRTGDGPPGGSVTDIAFLVPTWTLQRSTKESPGSLRPGGFVCWEEPVTQFCPTSLGSLHRCVSDWQSTISPFFSLPSLSPSLLRCHAIMILPKTACWFVQPSNRSSNFLVNKL